MQRGKRRARSPDLPGDAPTGANAADTSPALIGRADRSQCGASLPASGTEAKASKPSGGTSKQSSVAVPSLRDEVRQALRGVLKDKAASAAAKASAGRTLLEYFEGESAIESRRGRRATELTADELDEEIARLTSLKE